MHPAIKLRHIRAFLDIATEGSLTGVARARGVTQPALSRTLSELEDLLGVQLFRREKRRLILTEQGLMFRSHASLGLQMLEAGVAALSPGSGGGVIRVGILPTVATRLFPRAAIAFQRLMPQVRLVVETGPYRQLLAMVRKGEIDLMVGRMPAPTDMAALAFDHLYEEEVVLVTRAGQPPVTDLRRHLARVPLVVPTEGAIIRRVVDDYLASLGLSGLRPCVETVALAVGRGILAGSDAVWFISRGVVYEELARGEVVELPTGVGFLTGAVGLTRRQAGRPAPGLDVLLRLLHEAAQ
jgi:LysR family pca operon transcriptional activator